jgi:uncharacterized repeat protein (TIGR03803 family)
MIQRKTNVAVLVGILTFVVCTCAASTEKVLHAFTGGSDGKQPYAGLIFDQAGNLYGTTESGGAHGLGVVFRLTRTATAWKEKVLHSFAGGSDGAIPIGGVILDGAGNLYGTTSSGGDAACQCGNVFELSPLGSGWKKTTLYNFTGGSDGASPGAGLVFDGAGNLYGTTVYGGQVPKSKCTSDGGCGTIFKLAPTGTGWTEFVVQRFGGSDGSQPFAALTFDANGILCGTTYAGGAYGLGTAFGEGSRHSFNATAKAGSYLLGSLVSDSGSNLYGATYNSPAPGQGAVFKLRPAAGGPSFITTVLHTFTGSDGSQPAAGLIFDGAGNLYGTTTAGGASSGFAGTVFKLTLSGTHWTETVLYSFTGGKDGAQPYAGVILDQAGNLYGTTLMGGAHGAGVVFEVIP